MVVAHDFLYQKPSTLLDALKLRAQYGEKCSLLAGGTDLVVNIKERRISPDIVIDIKGIPEFSILEERDGSIFIGSAITFTELIESPLIKSRVPIIAESAHTVASVGVRNRATLVGNICSAVPSLDSAPALLVYKTDVVVESVDGKRIIPIDKWFVAPKKTALQNNEIVLGVLVEIPNSENGTAYMKLGRYSGEDLAQAGVGIMISKNLEYKIAFCAVGPVPRRALKVEAFLNGKEFSSITNELSEIIQSEISPITDIRASKEYRRHMVDVLVERGIKLALSRLQGE
ncbi:xanthine dehydrogenase family protein subunit M [bacterium]|nr:xanthine dehydrogenase family protein subunit M [bacterium]